MTNFYLFLISDTARSEFRKLLEASIGGFSGYKAYRDYVWLVRILIKNFWGRDNFLVFLVTFGVIFQNRKAKGLFDYFFFPFKTRI